MYLVHRCCKHFISTVFIIAAIIIFSLSGTAWATDIGVINSSVVNVRTGPGTTYTIAGTILENTQVQILQTQGSWDKIQYGSLAGWVSSSLITTNQSTATSTTVTSAPATTVTTTTPPRVLLDGKELIFEVPPRIEGSRTLVPLRAIFEAMGAVVQWDQSTQTVTATKGNKVVVLPLNSTSPTINGVVYPLDTTAQIINNRALAPLRFVGEAFDGTVKWDAAAGTINISSPQINVTPTEPSPTPTDSQPSTSGTTGTETFYAKYPVVQEYIDNNRPGTALNPTGQVVHATADPGAAAQNIHDYFNNHPDAEASSHAVIDWDTIIEMIPENEIAWHAGPTANSLYLSFEMCEPAEDDPDRDNKFQEVWDRAVWYCAKTCVKYGWNTNDNIFSHNAISQMYHETNHTDPYGYFTAYGKTWDQFLAAVDAEIVAMGE